MPISHQVTSSWPQGWGQIRFIKYKYKYKNLDFSNTNTNILLKFDSNTNTNTSIQIQIQIRSTKYICRKLFGSKIGQFYKSQDICSWSVFPPNVWVTFAFQEISLALKQLGGVGGGTWLWDRNAQYRPLTRNAIKGQKGESALYISPNFYKKRFEIRHSLIFFLKYQSRNYTNFPETWKKWGWNDGAYVRHEIVQFFLNWFP